MGRWEGEKVEPAAVGGNGMRKWEGGMTGMRKSECGIGNAECGKLKQKLEEKRKE